MEEGSNDGRTFYYCPKCPYPEECNEKCFKKWECWGWTEEAARKRVLDHLKGSGLHKDHCSGTDDRWAECEAAVEHELEIKQDIHHEQPEESGKKRRGKASQGVGGSRASDTFAEPRAKSAAVAMMNKPLNRKGCILDQRRRKNNPYPWTDPGNFAHPPFRKLLGFAASFVMGRQNERPEIHGAALVLKDVQEYVKARWPRADGSARLAELHGDLFEMSLALGYLDNRDMPLVRMLSVPICHVRDIVSYVETQGPEDRTRDITATSPLSRPKAQHVTAMANTLWNAGQVQYYRVGAVHRKYPGYVEFARRAGLVYR